MLKCAPFTLTSVFHLGGFLYLMCLDTPAHLFRVKERPDLHADGLEWVPAALPVHPHHAIICAMLGHASGVRPTYVVSTIGIGWVAAVVPPAASIFSGTLFGRISRVPGLDKRNSTSTQSAVITGKAVLSATGYCWQTLANRFAGSWSSQRH